MSFAIDEGVPKVSVKNIFQRFIKNFRQKKISSQVAITYTLILFLVMLISNFFTNAGINYLFHHQADRAIELSLARMMKSDDDKKEFLDVTAAMSSVIVRVVDEHGNILANNSPLFPDTDTMMKFVVKDKPFFANKDYTLIETPHSFFYYREVPVEVDGEILRVQMFRTITFEKEFINYMSWVSMFLDIFGLLLAVAAGYFLMRKILRPLKQVTETAREISKGDMNKRLTVEESGNEVLELASSFNFMLDKINETFSRQQQFISDASHELRTPITVISGYADILKKFGAQDKELLDESTAVIQSEADNMKTLLDSLLFLARADQGNQHLDKLPVSVKEVLREVADAFQSPRVKFLSDVDFEIIGDESALKKMFAAILDNALKYSDDTVTINLELTEDAAEVHIIDSGVGISKEDQKKIFDRFYRVDKSRTKSDDENSVGLGLSVAKWIADKHGIKIEIDSEVDKGTDFILLIKC